MSTRPSFSGRHTALLLSIATLLLGSGPAPAAEGKLIEKLVDVPRDTKVAVGISFEKATLVWVESQNDPKEKDVREATQKDPKDSTWVLIRFYYRNDDYVRHKVKLRAILLDENDTIVGDANRGGTLDPQKEEDTFSFPMRVKTVDWPKAVKMKVSAAFQN